MKRIQISVAGLMILPVILALDLAAVRAIPSVMSLSTRIGLFGALPMANVLAIDLALVASALVNRGEIPLSRAAFLFAGGTAILILVYTAVLAPVAFFDYVELTAGPLQALWLSPAQKAAVAQGRLLPPLHGFGMGRINVVQVVLAGTALTPPVLLPALLAGWLTRGYRLRLVPAPAAGGGRAGGSPSEAHD